MTTKFTERVICLYCDKTILRKNLEFHNKTKHGGDKLSCLLYQKIWLLFGKAQETLEYLQVPGTSTANASEDNLEPPFKVACVEPADTETVEKPKQSPSLDTLLMKIGELSSQVNRLICVCREKNTGRTVSESSSSTDNIPNKDEKCMIISHPRSVDQILKWLENRVLDYGMK